MRKQYWKKSIDFVGNVLQGSFVCVFVFWFFLKNDFYQKTITVQVCLSHLVQLALLSQSIGIRKINMNGFENMPAPAPGNFGNLKIDGNHVRASRIQVVQNCRCGLLIIEGRAWVERRQTPVLSHWRSPTALGSYLQTSQPKAIH